MEKGSYDIRNTGAISAINSGVGKLNAVLPGQLGKIGTIDEKGTLAVGKRTGGYQEIAEARAQARLDKEKKTTEADKKLLDRANQDRINEGKRIQEGIATQDEIERYVRNDPTTRQAAATALGKTVDQVTKEELDNHIKSAAVQIKAEIEKTSTVAAEEEKAREDAGEARKKADEASKAVEEVTRDADNLAKTFDKPAKEVVKLREQIRSLTVEQTELAALEARETDVTKKAELTRRKTAVEAQLRKATTTEGTKFASLSATDKVDVDNHKLALDNVQTEYDFALEDKIKKKVEADTKRMQHAEKQKELVGQKQKAGYKRITDSIKAAEKAQKDAFKAYATNEASRLTNEYNSMPWRVVNTALDVVTFNGFGANGVGATREGGRRSALYYRDLARGRKPSAPAPRP
jgi:hypothetical protein